MPCAMPGECYHISFFNFFSHLRQNEFVTSELPLQHLTRLSIIACHWPIEIVSCLIEWLTCLTKLSMLMLTSEMQTIIKSNWIKSIQPDQWKPSRWLTCKSLNVILADNYRHENYIHSILCRVRFAYNKNPEPLYLNS